MPRPVSFREVENACEHGLLLSLQHWKDTGRLPDLMQATAGLRPQEIAAANGHLELLHWIVDHSGQAIDLTVDDQLILQVAARHGQLEIARWLLHDSGQHFDITANRNEVLKEACWNNQFEIVKWLIDDLDVIQGINDETELLRLAIVIGKFDTVAYLLLRSTAVINFTQVTSDLFMLSEVAYFVYGCAEFKSLSNAELCDKLTALHATTSQRQKLGIWTLHRFLDEAGISRDRYVRGSYLQSPTVQKLIEAGLLSTLRTFEELEVMLKTDTSQLPTDKNRRL